MAKDFYIDVTNSALVKVLVYMQRTKEIKTFPTISVYQSQTVGSHYVTDVACKMAKTVDAKMIFANRIQELLYKVGWQSCPYALISVSSLGFIHFTKF